MQLNTKTSLYIADDHQIVIDGLMLLMSNEENLVVIGTATNGENASKEIIRKKPDIAIVDFRMPGMNGLDLISTIRKYVNTRFIILSMHNEPRYIKEAISFGAMGYVIKNTGKAELLHCINEVVKGEQSFPSIRKTNNSNVEVFTPRELEILKLVIDDNSTQAIADTLHLSHYTVETHRKNICRKAGAKTVAGLLKYISDWKIEL